MKQKLMSFMQGRNGVDELNICLLVLYCTFMLLAPLNRFFSSLALVCIFYAVFRMFSKNLSARRRENCKIVPYISFVKALVKNRKTHRVFLCPTCKRSLRIPKGKGRVTINCPCGNTLKRKS